MHRLQIRNLLKPHLVNTHNSIQPSPSIDSKSTKFISTNTLPLPCAINNLPYDIFQEIFSHFVLSWYRGLIPRPSEGPMLLCHVSQCWRMVALTSPLLWTHLHYTVTMQRIEADPGYAVLMKDLRFIKWWKANHQSIPPFLCFWVRITGPDEIRPEYFAAGGALDFILTYIASGQHVKLSPLYWRQLHQRQIVCPNVRSMGICSSLGWVPSRTDNDAFYNAQSILALSSGHKTWPPSPLQHLIIDRIEIQNIIIPKLWSSLTHVSMVYPHMSLGVWSTLIRVLPNLQWGRFCFMDDIRSTEWAEPPTKYEKHTLHHLTALSISCNSLFHELFSNLHFPALHTLSIDGCSRSEWKEYNATTYIHTILKSTPKIRTLSLGENFLRLGTCDPPSYRRGYTWQAQDRDDRGLKPIWTNAPLLKDLQLKVPRLGLRFGMATVVEEVLQPDKWLDIKNSACPIRTITLVSSSINLSSIREHGWDRIGQCRKAMPAHIDLRIALEGSVHDASAEYLEWSSRSSIS